MQKKTLLAALGFLLLQGLVSPASSAASADASPATQDKQQEIAQQEVAQQEVAQQEIAQQEIAQQEIAQQEIAQQKVPTTAEAATPPAEPPGEASGESAAADDSALPPDSENAAASAEAIKVAAQNLEHYKSRIEELETSQGAYGADIGEIYLEAGLALELLGRHEEAALSFGKALQAVRVSNGLNDVQQLPILAEMKKANEQLQNWEEVDSAAHLMFHIARSNYPAGDPRRLQALKTLARWKMQDAQDGLTPSSSASADEVFDLYKNEIELLEATEDFPGRNLHLATALLDRAAVDMWLAERTFNRSLNEFQTTGIQRSITTTQCQMVRLRDGSVVQICNTVEVPNMDYYLEPSAKKGQEIQNHLIDMKRSVVEAYNYLEPEQSSIEEKNIMLREVVRLTAQYNDFVNSASSTTPLAMRRNSRRNSGDSEDADAVNTEAAVADVAATGSVVAEE